MMSKVSNKMDDVAKGGYSPANMIRHIAQGQNRLVKQAIRLDIAGVMEDFSTDMLTELYKHVKFLLLEEQAVSPEAPACPRIDEQEVDGGCG